MSVSCYVKNIWFARYFWSHLAISDLRTKYRRSSLGIIWALLQPLAFTVLLAFVMGRVFNSPITDYAPFIFSGLILWEFITASAINGCAAFVNAGVYIKQFSHPLAIYALRNTLTCLINFSVAFVGLIIWVLIWKPSNFGWTWLSLEIAFPLLFLMAWFLAIITAFVGAKFHDFTQLMTIILQAIWYISPIFFLPKMFYAANISFLVDYNPIFHFLNLFRLPLLEGKFPTSEDYFYAVFTLMFLGVLASLLIWRQEKKIIFYL